MNGAADGSLELPRGRAQGAGSCELARKDRQAGT